MKSIFQHWTDKDTDNFKNHILLTQHRLHENPLFTDKALKNLIGKHPTDLSMVYALPRKQGAERSFREGTFADRSPDEIMQAVEHGQLWVQLLQLNKTHPEFAALEKDIIAEMKQNIPGFKPSRCKLSLLISSPGINVSYHADIPRNALWHLRGEKRVYIYPPTAPFIPDESLENICLGTTQESLPYQKEFDTAAYIADMKPGDVATWPVNAPHRIENKDSLNVSLVMEYFEPHALLKYGVYYTNGTLRNRFGIHPKSTLFTGPIAWMKLLSTFTFKTLKLQKLRQRPRYLTFAIDPESPRGFIDIDQRLRK